uniref:Uncharacterized protein n=1 Tax=Anopheles maculatus TaxID=74869 RepID=A0A182SDJ6_9DIPT
MLGSKRLRRSTRNQLDDTTNEEDDDDDDSEQDARDEETTGEGRAYRGPPSKQNEDDEEEEDDDDDDDDDEDDQNVRVGRSTRQTVPSSSSSARPTRRMRARKLPSDHEQSPEETSNISKRSSATQQTQRVATGQNHPSTAGAGTRNNWYASESDNDVNHSAAGTAVPAVASTSFHAVRSSRRLLVESSNAVITANGSASGSSMVRRTITSTSTVTSVRRLRGTEGNASSGTATPPPHTVDHNYGEPGPSARSVASSSGMSGAVSGTSASAHPSSAATVGGAAISALRRTRTRSTVLSRHQRNPDELDQSVAAVQDAHQEVTNNEIGGGADDGSDEDDNQPLRMMTANPRSSRSNTARQLRARTGADGSTPSKRKSTRISSSHEEDVPDGADSDDSDDSDDDNTPLHMMAGSSSRTRSSRSQTASVAGTPKKNENNSTTPFGSRMAAHRTRRKERYTSDEEYEVSFYR